jgi:hypothetical protein
MRATSLSTTILLALLVLPFAPANAAASGEVTDEIDLVRSIYKTERQAFVAESLPLTPEESAAFWPLYKSYRAEMEKLGDDLVKVVLEYADVYPNVQEESARRLLKNYSALETKLANTRTKYFKKAGKILPAAKVLRWAQLENRMDLALRLQLAGTVPVAPSKP